MDHGVATIDQWCLDPTDDDAGAGGHYAALLFAGLFMLTLAGLQALQAFVQIGQCRLPLLAFGLVSVIITTVAVVTPAASARQLVGLLVPPLVLAGLVLARPALPTPVEVSLSVSG